MEATKFQNTKSIFKIEVYIVNIEAETYFTENIDKKTPIPSLKRIYWPYFCGEILRFQIKKLLIFFKKILEIFRNF